jgi:PST family polysaccharide transporter
VVDASDGAGHPLLSSVLGSRTASGALLTVGGQGVRILIQVVGVVILARLLTPRDYGLVALVMAVIGIAEVLRDMGLSMAAVQALHLSVGQRTNLFWINVGLGAALVLVAWAVAPFVAKAYGIPELEQITRILSLTFVVNGFATQFRADLVRRMQFARLAFVDICAPAAALVVSVVLAARGVGYWALVVQQISSGLVMVLALGICAGWLPGLPTRGAPVSGILRFGWRLALAQIVGYLTNNIEAVVIGARLGPTPLGLYNRGYQLLMVPLVQLLSPTTTVALPVLSRLRDDRERFSRYVIRGQSTLGFTLVSGIAVLVGAATPLTRVFLGPQWDGVAPLLRLLAIGGALQVLAYVGYWVYLALALGGRLLAFTLFMAATKVSCIVVGSTWGVEGVAWGFVATHAIDWPVSLWWLSRSAQLPVRQMYAGAGRILVLALCMGWAAYAACVLTSGQSAIVQLVAAGATSLSVYLLVGLSVPFLRDDIRGVISLVRKGLVRI